MNSSDTDLPMEIKLIGDQFAFSCMTVSSLAWLSYDIVITIHREVDAVWRRKWTTGKMLYLIARYYALLNLISYAVVVSMSLYIMNGSNSRSCYKYMNFFVSGQLLIPFFVDSLLILRLYAMFNGDRRILAFLMSCLVVQTVLLIFSSYSTINEVVILQKIIPFRGCRFVFPQDRPRTYIAWIFAMVLQVIYFTFTLVKYVKTICMFRSQSPNGRSLWRAVWESRDLHPVFTLFVRDGTAAFLIILAAHFVNVFTMIFVAGPLQRSGRPWIVAASAVMASRVYLNLGKSYRPYASSRPQNYPHTITRASMAPSSLSPTLCSPRTSLASTIVSSPLPCIKITDDFDIVREKLENFTVENNV